jgi:agmatine/peptidylarginine deiminase
MFAIRFVFTSVFVLVAFAGFAVEPAKPKSVVRATPDFAEPAVVVVALTMPDAFLFAEQPREVHRAQVEIAAKASAVSPVVLLVPDAEMKLEVIEHCERLSQQICDGLASDRIRVEVGRHRSPWIRDYGPQFATASDGQPILLDAHYHDVRNDVRRREKLAEINQKRLRDLERFPQAREEAVQQALGKKLREGWAQQIHAAPDAEPEESEEGEDVAPVEPEETDETEDTETPDGETPEVGVNPADEFLQATSTEESEEARDVIAIADDDEEAPDRAESESEDEAADAEDDDGEEEMSFDEFVKQLIDKETREAEASLAYHTALYEVVEKHSGARGVDDESPLALGLALFSDLRFKLRRPEINLDGGNFLRASDGRCLTTRDLLTRNFGREDELRRILAEEYGCVSDVVFLRALPGGDGVIEHVDMFALPAPDKRIFLASYTPDNLTMARYWSELSPSMQRLATEAAIAMKANVRTLRDLGYDVIEIPSPLPRKTIDDQLYYPTILNGVLHTNGTISQLLLPRYAGYQEDLQTAALEKIRETIGAHTLVDTIESTASAQGQGAVHCLTILLPQKWTVFDSKSDRDARATVLAAVQAIDPTMVAAKGDQDRLEGVWHILGPEGDHGLFDAQEMKLVFRGSQVRLKFGKSTEHDTTFDVRNRQGRQWTLDIRGKETMKIEWEGADRFQILREDDVPLTAVRR